MGITTKHTEEMNRSKFYILLETSEDRLNTIAQLVINNNFSMASKKEVIYRVNEAMQIIHDIRNTVMKFYSGIQSDYTYSPFSIKNNTVKDKRLVNQQEISNVESVILEKTVEVRMKMNEKPLFVIDEQSFRKYTLSEKDLYRFEEVKQQITAIEQSLRLQNQESTQPEEESKKSFFDKISKYLNGPK